MPLKSGSIVSCGPGRAMFSLDTKGLEIRRWTRGRRDGGRRYCCTRLSRKNGRTARRCHHQGNGYSAGQQRHCDTLMSALIACTWHDTNPDTSAEGMDVGRGVTPADVHFGSKADMCSAQADVRFTPNSGQQFTTPDLVLGVRPFDSSESALWLCAGRSHLGGWLPSNIG
jgi:hypothetical protein